MTDTELNGGCQSVLDAMPKIAEAVNAFTSEDVQKRAFETLVAALGINRALPPVPNPAAESKEPAGSEAEADAEAANDEGNPGRRAPARKKAPKRTFAVPKNLNFSPTGKTSLEDFVAEKQPGNHDERSLIACHYLSEVMGLTDIDTGKILAVYSAAGWNAPAHPASSLTRTASVTGWIDTTNMKAISVPWKGTNQISKMPIEKKSKA